jgi:hypothetical protein
VKRNQLCIAPRYASPINLGKTGRQFKRKNQAAVKTRRLASLYDNQTTKKWRELKEHGE